MLAVLFFVSVTVCVPFITHASEALDAHSLIAFTNKDRESRGVKILVEDPLLNLAAERKARDMAARGYFSHTTPNGKTPWSWLISLGYYYTKAGENLATNFGDSASVERAWMQSPTHRANIMENMYTRVGVGVAHGMYQGAPTTFVVQFFATPYVEKRT